MGNAMTDLTLASNLSTIPREFFPDFEDMGKPEFSSPLPSPLDCLLARENGFAVKTEIGDDVCILPSSFYKDGFGIYSICFHPMNPYATKENVRAYVHPEIPELIIQDDCFEILPKFQPIRIMDKYSFYEAHGKRGRKPFNPKDDRMTIRKLPLPS